METLDLHGVRYHEVDRMVENFVLLENLPVRVITGNSPGMRSLVVTVLIRHQLNWSFESFFNLGSLIITA